MLTLYLKDLKTSNVQHTDERHTLESRGKSFITLGHQPTEHTVVDSLGHGAHRVVALVNVHAFSHKLSTDLDLRLGDVLVQISAIHYHHLGDLVTSLIVKRIIIQTAENEHN